MASSAGKPHFLLLPLPEQGHITPMLSLASHLATHGCTVTFLKAEKAPLAAATLNGEKHALDELTEMQDPAPAAVGTTSPSGSHLRFRTLQRMPGGASSHPIATGSSLFDILKYTVAGLEERQGMVEEMVQESKVSEAPIACIICDIVLCQWVVNVAKRQAILAAVLVPCAAFNFYVPYLAKLGRRKESEGLYRRVGLIESNKADETTTSEQLRKKNLEKLTWYLRQCEGVEEASHILVNSFKHLEPFIVESMEESKLNFKFIGPCLPTWEDGDSTSTKGDIMAKEAGCLHKEELASLTWLDQQEKRSVLLVSFGSEAILEAKQVQEFAMGIEASGYGYLWVVRVNAPLHNMPPDDFRERTRHLGMCVPWVPQRKVLQHDAIGGFLTHCGWNSTLESIVYGVPLLCFPMNGDQFFNALLIHKHWKVGLPLGTSRGVLVSRAEVEEALKSLRESHDLHQHVVQFQRAAQRALLESQKSVASLVQDTIRS